jgi:hypothetical protein
MSGFERGARRSGDGAREDDEAAIQDLAVELVEGGLDWRAAMDRARRTFARARQGHAERAMAPQRSRVRGAPGKMARTTGLDARPAIQARSGASPFDPDSEEMRALIRDAADRAIAGGGGKLPHLAQIQKAFGRYDVSQVEAHVGGTTDAAVRAMGAEAFAAGSHVAFAGAPSLFTAAHEAAHVLQQRAGVDVDGGVGRDGDRYERHADAVAERVVRGESAVDLIESFIGPAPAAAPGAAAAETAAGAIAVQMRRVAPNVQALLTAIGGGADGVNFDANAAGVERMIARAMAELTPAERAQVLIDRRLGADEPTFLALPRRTRLSQHCQAIIALASRLELGDPARMNRAPTGADATHLPTLVTNADTRFGEIAAGTHDAHIDSVFGTQPGHRTFIKARYAAARTRMNWLHSHNQIVTDRSGYNDEALVGGLTGHDQIAIEFGIFATAAAAAATGSIITLMHEAMHAGNSSVTDHIYVGDTGFETAEWDIKKTNAAHYEVPLWRAMAPASAGAYANPVPPPAFLEFVPAGAIGSGGGAPTAARTTMQNGALAAYNRFREGWTLGLNLHNVYQELFLTPTHWTGARAQYGGAHLNTSVPFWSKVQKLTIHEKATITPGSADPAARPVSTIDMALSEGLVRKLALGKDLLGALHTDAQITSYMSTATAAELAAATTEATIRDLLVKLTLRNAAVGPLTDGSEDRNFRTVNQMGTMPDNWAVILANRNPSSFAD